MFCFKIEAAYCVENAVRWKMEITVSHSRMVAAGGLKRR